MLHLLNKVYIKPDADFQRGHDAIIISPKTKLFDSELFGVDDIDFGKIHFTAETFDALVEVFGSEDAFVQWLVYFDPSTRLVVHCDPATFEHILVRWLKTILPNMDGSSFHSLIRIIYARYGYQFGYPYVPFVRLTPDAAAVYKSFLARIPSKEQAVQMWNQAQPYTVNVDSAAVSLEYQLATYLDDPTWEHTDQLKAKVITMVKKFQVGSLLDVKEVMLGHLYMLPDFDQLKDTLVHYVTEHLEYTFLLDMKLTSDDYTRLYDQYNTAVLRQIYIDYFKMHADIFDETQVEKDHFLDPAITFEQIIDNELASIATRQLLGSWEYGLTVNTYLLDHLFALERANDQAELKKFSLLRS